MSLLSRMAQARTRPRPTATPTRPPTQWRSGKAGVVTVNLLPCVGTACAGNRANAGGWDRVGPGAADERVDARESAALMPVSALLAGNGPSLCGAKGMGPPPVGQAVGCPVCGPLGRVVLRHFPLFGVEGQVGRYERAGAHLNCGSGGTGSSHAEGVGTFKDIGKVVAPGAICAGSCDFGAAVVN